MASPPGRTRSDTARSAECGGADEETPQVIAERPAPKDKADAAIVFLRSSGRRWVRLTEKSRTDNLSVCFGELMKKLGMHREGLNFSALRHTFRTVADAARDPVAIDLIMGHSDPSMRGHSRERIEDSRLRAVAEHVRAWLFGKAPGADPPETGPEICDPSDPSNPDEEGGGSEGEQGLQTIEPELSADPRPALRLYVG